jgi:transposase
MSAICVSSPELRRRFVLAYLANTPVGQMTSELGIATSTYYKWRQKWVELGEQWVSGKRVTRAVRLSDATDQESRSEIVAMSLQYPDLGPKKLCQILKQSRGYTGSHSSVHNILAAEQFGTRKSRVDELYRQLKAGENLSDEQIRVVEGSYPMARFKWPKGSSPGDVLIQDVVRFHHSSPFGSARMSIAVDTCSGYAFACFNESSTSDLATDCARLAIEQIKQRYRRGISVIYTDKDTDFGINNYRHAYTTLLRVQRIHWREVDWPTRRPNPYVADVWDFLRTLLCSGDLRNPEQYRNTLWTLNLLVQGNLDAHWNL